MSNNWLKKLMFPTHDQCCLQLSVNFHSDQNLRNDVSLFVPHVVASTVRRIMNHWSIYWRFAHTRSLSLMSRQKISTELWSVKYLLQIIDSNNSPSMSPIHDQFCRQLIDINYLTSNNWRKIWSCMGGLKSDNYDITWHTKYKL